MSTFSLGNLRFLDDIADVEQFSVSERKSTPATTGQANNQTSSNLTSSTLVESSSLLNSSIQETRPANNEQLNNQPNDQLNSSSSSSVEFDENLDVLNEYEGSEPNSLRTVDYSYSENHTDPNPAYQSVFTLSTINGSTNARSSRSSTTEDQNTILSTIEKRPVVDEKEIRKGDHFDFDFNEATFKPRPYRPKSAVKRRSSSSDLSEEIAALDTGSAKLNPLTDHKRPGPLSHRFWAEIEQEVLQEENEENEIKEESLKERDLRGKNSNDELNSKGDRSDERIEESESLSSEKDANEDEIDEEHSKEIVDEDALDGTENLERDSERDSENGSNDSQANEQTNESIDMLNELKSQINRLLSARSESKADDRLIGELNEIKQLVGQPNLNRKLQQIKTELIDEFGQMLAGELSREKQRKELELSDFRRQLENLEQQFDRQIKSMERNLLDSVKSSLNNSINNSTNSNQPATDSQVEQQLSRLISELEQLKSASLADAKQRDRTITELTSKLDWRELSSSIAGLHSRIDLILTNKSKLTKNAEGAKRSIYSSDEDSSADELVRKLDEKLDEKLNAKLDNKLDDKLNEIKLLLNQIRDSQKIDSSKSNDKDDLIEEDLLVENRKQTNEILLDRNKSERPIESQDERKKPLEESNECDLCEMTSNIRSNIREFRSTFYRQKLKTYAGFTYAGHTSGFLDRLDQQIRLGDANTEHDHSLNRPIDDRLNGELEDRFGSKLENRLNSRIRLFIHETSKDVRESVKQLKQLGNYKFEANGQTPPLDDSHRLKQIQQMRFNINRRLIKLNEMIVNNY